MSCDLPQVSTYSEDFQSERSDRERAQGEIDQLKSETETLRQVIQIMVRTCVCVGGGGFVCAEYHNMCASPQTLCC